MNCNNQVYINGRFLTQSLTGVQRYAREVVKAIDALLSDPANSATRYRFCLLSPRDHRADLGLKHISTRVVGRLTGHPWEQLELPLYSRKGLLLNLCNTGPLMTRNQIATIHDASVYGFPSAYSSRFRCWYKLLYHQLGKHSRAVNTVSQFSKDELVKYRVAREAKLNVIYEGKEHLSEVVPDYSIIERNGLSRRPYLFAVSSMNPNKNFHSVVHAIELLAEDDFDVVIAGGTNPRIFSRTSMPFSNRVIQIGYVSDSELKALYQHAACFLYPSFYEGFGLPPLEAMAAGCPAIVSQSASLPEVCGDAVLYCDPHSPEDIAEKVRLLLKDENLLGSLRERGQQRAGLFSWDRCARQTVQVIEKVLLQ